MKELVITIMLLVPSPYKLVGWSVNEVPTQIQVSHKSGLQVSYTATPVSCKTRPKHELEMVFQATAEHCYLVKDLSDTKFIRQKDFGFPVRR